jgi:hypothetical protein
VTGFPENSIQDLGCPTPQVLHFEPVAWEKEVIHEVPTYGAMQAASPETVKSG